MVSYLIKAPESLKKMRDEFSSMVDTLAQENPEIKTMGTEEMLKNAVNHESVIDLEFVGQVISETLRFEPPANNTSSYKLKEDVTVKNINFRQGDEIIFHVPALHRNSKQWQRPDEFLPERFDPQSPLYLTPDGKKRNAFAWFPFNGGQRICFGKTFAEANMRFIITYFTQFFDFEYCADEKIRYKDSYPRAFALRPNNIPIMVKISKRK